jgi:hypothetical protein
MSVWHDSNFGREYNNFGVIYNVWGVLLLCVASADECCAYLATGHQSCEGFGAAARHTVMNFLSLGYTADWLTYSSNLKPNVLQMKHCKRHWALLVSDWGVDVWRNGQVCVLVHVVEQVLDSSGELCIYISIYLYRSVRVYISTYLHQHISVPISTSLHQYVSTSAYICTDQYMSTSVCIYISIYLYRSVRVYISMYLHR